jgi:hypothetical protein
MNEVPVVDPSRKGRLPGTEPATARELDELATRLGPEANRALILERFDELFRSGGGPDPPLEGFLPGRLLATSTRRPLDAFGRVMAGLWMPWRGKWFDRDGATGVNRFTPGGLAALRILFPRYTPERISVDTIEAFAFRTRLGPAELDAGVQVLKIDYDDEANPRVVRRILDELVQLEPGLYLGRVLFRTRRRHHPVGFFSLRAAE